MGLLRQPVHRLLVVAGSDSQFGLMKLADFDVEEVTTTVAALQALETTTYDCVVLCWPGPTSLELSRIHDVCDTRVIPLLLAAQPSAHGLKDLLATRPFDGFLDHSWEDGLLSSVLLSAVQRFQTGRNVVEIQRNVLHSIRSEFDELRSLVFRDDLTQLHNLRYFREIISKEHARCRRHNRPYTLLYVDLDGLREVNNNHGHGIGGRVLAQLGETVAAHTRACDYAFRVGGDEFAVLLVETTKYDALNYAEALCERIRNRAFKVGDLTLKLTASMGVASFPKDGSTGEEVLKNADKAMYMAKASGKDRVVCFDATLRQ